MAARKPLALINGMLQELPSTDGVSAAIQPNVYASPTLTMLQIGELAVDSVANALVLRIGNLLYSFTNTGLPTSFVGELDFSKLRNSHWVGSGLI